MAGATTATAKMQAQQASTTSSTKQASEEQLPLWRELLIGCALAYFVGSILLATVMYIATAMLIFTSPSSPWGWTLAAVVVGAGVNSVSVRQHSSDHTSFVSAAASLHWPQVLIWTCSQPTTSSSTHRTADQHIEGGDPSLLCTQCKYTAEVLTCTHRDRHPTPCWLQAALSFWPLGPKPSWVARQYTSYCCREAPRYFRLKVLTEEGASFNPNKPYIVGKSHPKSCLRTDNSWLLRHT
jgi:hypothetical protein